MGRFQNMEEVCSVLYVDFDNIYTRLAEQDPALARAFATNPQRWMRWIEGHALRMMYGEGVRRRILKKCCYLNPHRYHEFRPFFIRAAFQVVDCPPLTNYGKTSADIHLVMDCMDALAHVTRFDEFIILSGDADFTPLLLRIQEHARRSLVLSVGYASPAYVAACSWRIREDWFIAQALEDPREEEQEGGRAYEPRAGDRDGRAPEMRDRRPDVRPAGENGRQASISLVPAKRRQIIDTLKHTVAESSVPVPLPSVAQVLQHNAEARTDWFGAGSLRDLLQQLDLSPLEFSAVGPGYIFDPQRHDAPQEAGDREFLRQRLPQLYDFAVKVNRLTDIPLLLPDTYRQLRSLLVAEIREHGFSRAETAHHVEERCREEGLAVTAAQVSFVMEAVIRGGLTLTDAVVVAGMDEQAVRKAFFQRAVDLCRLSQVSLSDQDMRMLGEWLQ
jgi:hypothetical protein